MKSNSIKRDVDYITIAELYAKLKDNKYVSNLTIVPDGENSFAITGYVGGATNRPGHYCFSAHMTTITAKNKKGYIVSNIIKSITLRTSERYDDISRLIKAYFREYIDDYYILHITDYHDVSEFPGYCCDMHIYHNDHIKMWTHELYLL